MDHTTEALRNLLSPRLRPDLKETAEELRLRLGIPLELRTGGQIQWGTVPVSAEDLQYTVNMASRYSPWNQDTLAQGYLTAPGGNRIGVCGKVVPRGRGIKELYSLCIRSAREIRGIARPICRDPDSLLILGAPGWGKTTLLRDLIRLRSDAGEHIAVVDQREEIFPILEGSPLFSPGRCTDILSGGSISGGIPALLRAMSPQTIAVDEITSQEDTRAILEAGWCGVRLIATAHAGSRRDFLTRPVYRPLAESGLFTSLVILQKDRTYRKERMDI